jgi:hypothetical protein
MHRLGCRQLPRNEMGVHKTNKSLTILVGKCPSVLRSSPGNSILSDVWFKCGNWKSGGSSEKAIEFKPTASIMDDVVPRPSLERM